MLGFLFIPKDEDPSVGCICKLVDGRVGKVEEVKEYSGDMYCKLFLYFQGKDEIIEKPFEECTVVSPKYATDEVKVDDEIVYYEDIMEARKLKIKEIRPVEVTPLNREEDLKDALELVCEDEDSIEVIVPKNSFGQCWYKRIYCAICKQAIQMGQHVERNKEKEIVHTACSIGDLKTLN